MRRTALLLLAAPIAACDGGETAGDCPSGWLWDSDSTQCYQKDDDGDGWADVYDCDDDNPAVHPGAGEICDGVDNDCNGLTDDGDGNVLAETVFYADVDGDGHAGSTFSKRACDKPEGYYPTNDDCDDVDASTYPDALELCDGVDNDCDGVVDDDAVCTDDFYGDITITSPEGAVAFCERYSGIVYGTVTLSGYSFNDLGDVSCIDAIYGSLVVDLPLAAEVSRPALTLVDGDVRVVLYEGTESVRFQALTEAGVVVLENGPALETVDLSALESGLGLVVSNLPALEALSLPSTTHLGLLWSWNNTALAELDLPVLNTLENAEVAYNDSLTTLDLGTVTAAGDIALTGNGSLLTLDVTGATELGEVLLDLNPKVVALDLNTATSLGGLVLIENESLQTVTWTGIDVVDGDVIFYDNSSLSLPDHSNITQVSGDWGLWYSNTSSLDDLVNLEVLLGDLYLVDNGLQSVDLSNITQLGGLVVVNEDLDTLDLSDLEAPLTGSFHVAYNYDLVDFGWPEFDTLDGDFVWVYNGLVEAIEADTLVSVGGDLELDDASWGAVEDVELDQLQSVSGDMSLSFMDGVARLDLANLEEVGGSLDLQSLDILEEVDLGGLVTVGGDLSFYDVGRYADDFDIDVDLVEEVGGDLLFYAMAFYGDGGEVEFDFAALESVGSSLEVTYVNGYYGGDVTFLAPELTLVGGGVTLSYNGRSYNSSDTPGDVEVDLSAVETLGGALTVIDNGRGYYIGNNSSAGDVELDLSSMRSMQGTLTLQQNGYCDTSSSSWHCYAGSFAADLSKLESISNGSVRIDRNGYAYWGEGGDVSVFLDSLTSISGDLSLDYNGYAWNYRGYTGRYPYPGEVTLIFTDLETISGELDMYQSGYGYDGYYGGRYFADVDWDFPNLREVRDIRIYRSGIRDFDDWGSLETLSNDLYLQYNEQRNDVTGIHGGDTVDYSYISGNYSLGNSAGNSLVSSWSSVNSSYVSNN